MGSFVELSTGEMAAVVKVNESAIRCPVVSRVIDTDGEQIDSRNEIDLSEHTEIHIKRAATPEEVC